MPPNTGEQQERSQLLLTKLQVPRPVASLVRRDRLHALLDQGADRRLTLVSAPAGFGKSTLIADWLNEQDACAWLSLDEDDNDQGRFFLHLLAALQTLDASIGRSVQALVHALPQQPIKVAVTGLINDLATRAAPITLVLDDYHAITDWPVHEAMQFLLDHQPENLRLILITREDPPLPLSRLRARQQLLELRAADLRFTLEEAVRFFNQTMQLGLTKNVVESLERRTEGWAAGLHFAALSLRHSPDPLAFVKAFTGNDLYVLEYLVDEVLGRQPTEVQEFLIKTSILERFSAPLCDYVVFGEAHGPSAELIAHLERSNLFVVALDQDREWFRYHHLFADLLKSRLALRSSEDADLLHRRASRWHADHGSTRIAVKHALARHDPRGAADLVESQLLSLLATGTLPELSAALGQLPPEVAKGRPRLAVAQAWVTVHAGRLSEARAWLQEAERDMEQGDDDLRGHAFAVETYLSAMLGDMAGAGEVAKKALDLLSPDAVSARVFSLMVLAASQRFSARLPEAVESYERGRRLLQPLDEPYLQVLLDCSLAETLRVQGELDRAEQAYQEAIAGSASLRGVGGEPPWFVGYALTGLAAVLQERNQLDAALRHADEGVALCEKWGQADALVISYLDAAATYSSAGKLEAALAVAAKAVALAREVSPWPLAIALASEARLRIARGDLAAAERWADEADLDLAAALDYQHELLYVTLVRLLLAQGKATQAHDLLERLLAQAERVGSLSSVVENLILQALALHARGEEARALERLDLALQRAAPKGFVRLFLNEGPALTRLLYALAAQGTATAYCLDLLRAAPEAGEDRTRSVGRDPEPRLDPLSKRELEVLGLIAEGLTNGKIAQRLRISVHTVKAHSYNIYGKLDASNRTEAVAKARSFGVLEN